MYRFSRALFLEIKDLVDPHPDTSRPEARRIVLTACEATVERLARDRRYFTRPTRSLFDEIRHLFPLSQHARVYFAIERTLELAKGAHPAGVRPRERGQRPLPRDDTQGPLVPADAAAEPRVLPVARAPGGAAARRRGCLTAADPLAALVARAASTEAQAPSPTSSRTPRPPICSRSVPSSTVDLVYLDPPFGTGIARTGAVASATRTPCRAASTATSSGFAPLLGARAIACCGRAARSSCTSTGGRRTARASSLDELFGEDCFRNEIIWHYGLGGGAPADAFARKHDTILFYARSGAAIFHPERGPVTAAMDAKYAHVDELGRRYQNAHGRRYYLQGGKRLDDVWDLPALAPTARERVGWPTQKPLALLRRIVRAACDPGASVLDPCCGSGTALVAAAALGCRAVGGDRAVEAVELTAERLAALPAVSQTRPIVRVRDLDEQVLP